MNDGGNLCLELTDELLGVIFLRLNVAQFLLPDTRQFATLQQVFTNEVDEFDTSRSSTSLPAVSIARNSVASV